MTFSVIFSACIKQSNLSYESLSILLCQTLHVALLTKVSKHYNDSIPPSNFSVGFLPLKKGIVENGHEFLFAKMLSHILF